MIIQNQSFTPSEAAALAGLDEKKVRKEIEYKVLEATSPPRLSFLALVYLYVVRRSSLSLRVKERSEIYKRLSKALVDDSIPEEIEIENPLYLKLGKHVSRFREKVESFVAWKEQLTSEPGIMGGSETFPGHRLTVRRIGDALERGVSMDELREDYPYLTEQDFEFARLFVRAYPRTGRPAREDS